MKQKVQLFGHFLSSMVMPNIGAFIAWGFITALFIDTGWIPNKTFSAIVEPMSQFLLPILIGYTGGNVVAGQRGGIMGAIATMGAITASGSPMFIGAMIMGPLGGWVIRKFDKAIEGKVKAGFEMLVNNFSIGILGGILALISMVAVGPFVKVMTGAVEDGVKFLVEQGLLPLTSIIIEPAKVLFLNNALNHGIFTPIGMTEVGEYGKSVFFLLEANPGPGLGVLLAYCIAGKGSAKSAAPGAVLIHFFGGIHEIYFPYILMNPLLLAAVIAGGAGGVFTFNLLGAGLTAAASPGSIITIAGMAPKGGLLPVLAGVAVAFAVSFAISLPLVKFAGKEENLDVAEKKMKEMKAESKDIEVKKEGTVKTDEIKKIVFVCDAGMGSSAMGATVLRKKLATAGLESITVMHSPVSAIPADAQIVVTHEELSARASISSPNARIITIHNFLGAPEYDALIEELVQGK